MEALHDVVKAGKVRYLGASSMWAWQFAKLQHAADLRRLDPVRLHAGPVQPAQARGGARDVRPARRPGRRRRSRGARWRRAGSPGPGASRPHRSRATDVDVDGRPSYRDTRPGRSSTPCSEIAEARGVPMAQVALAWVLQQPGRRRADRRRHEAAPPRRRRRRARRQPHRRGDRRARGALHAQAPLLVVTHLRSDVIWITARPADAAIEASRSSTAPHTGTHGKEL